MDLFWKIVLISDAVMLIAIIPFALFRYEGDDQDGFVRRILRELISLHK